MNAIGAAIARVWSHKQAITGSVTTAVSLAAGAGLLSDAAAVKITAVTGILMTTFALVYSIARNPAPPEG